MNKTKKEVMQMEPERIEKLSDRFVEISEGLLYKRQTLAYLLFHVKEMDAEEISNFMGIEISTVYSLSKKGGEKFMAVKMVSEQFDGLEWYMKIHQSSLMEER